MNWWNKIWWKITCTADYEEYLTSDIAARLVFTHRLGDRNVIVTLTSVEYVEYINSPKFSINKHFKRIRR